MSFDEDIAIEVQRYLKETENKDCSIEEILNRPRWNRVWLWWKATGHISDLSLEEVKSIYGD